MKGRVLFFPGAESPGDLTPPSSTDRDPVTAGVPGDVWESGRSRRTFVGYCWHKAGDGVRYGTPSGDVTVFKGDWEVWCRRAQLVVDGAAVKQAAEDEERDHWRVAYGFVEYAILDADRERQDPASDAMVDSPGCSVLPWRAAC